MSIIIRNASSLTISRISFVRCCYLFCCICCFRADANVTVEGIANIVALRVVCIFRMIFALDGCQFRRLAFSYRHCSTNGSGNIITAIDLIDQDIVCGVLTIDMYKGVTTHIGHTCTTKHLTLRVVQWACCPWV